MGQFKDVGDPALAFAEECAEVIQIITKMKRFGGGWNEVAPGKDKSRWEMLKEEMADVMYQWDRLRREVEYQDDDYQGLGEYECSEGTIHGPNEQCDCPDSSSYFEPDDDDKPVWYSYTEKDKNPYPDYVIASTSFSAKETYVFEATENGEFVENEYGGIGELAGIAERWGDENWTSAKLAVEKLNTESHRYVRVSIKHPDKNLIHVLYKKETL